MATTHTLSADTLVSTLTLTDGDTIQLAGYNVIWDADTRATGVTITNSGAAARLELRNGGGIFLRDRLPDNVRPFVDDENHPLPDLNTEAGLTGNASFEIVLDNYMGLGGGGAILPTPPRPGNFWAKAVSFPTTSSVTFDRLLPIHVGDCLFGMNSYNVQGLTVTAWDEQSKTATVSGTISDRTAGGVFGHVYGGIAVRKIGGEGATSRVLFSSTVRGGTINVFFDGAGIVHNSASIFADALSFCPYPGTTINRYASQFIGFGNGSVECKKLIAITLFPGGNTLVGATYRFPFFIDINEIAAFGLCWNNTATCTLAKIKLCGGYIGSLNPPVSADLAVEAKNLEIKDSVNVTQGAACLANCRVNGAETGNVLLSKSGSVTLSETGETLPFSWYHAPATSADTTWRYEDRTVKPHSTLRIRALWKRGENSTATARAAITDPANWYPGTQGGALAEAVFPASENDDWQEARIEWRNDSDTDAQVRFWTCVTGDTAGGDFLSIEATGGPM